MKVIFAFVLLCLIAVQAKPNILLLVADDAGVGDVGIYGAPLIKTPNLDKLAREGMRFTQWNAPASLCTPSRGAMLTGRLPTRIGLYSTFSYPLDLILRVFYPSSVGGLPKNETTIAEELHKADYYNALVGKWHLGHLSSPNDNGFDYFYGPPYSHDEGYPGPFPTKLIWPPVPVYENDRIVEQPINMKTLTPTMTNIALDIMDDCAEKDQPFFLYMSYLEPHIPVFSSDEFYGVSRRGRFGDMMEQMDYSIGLLLDKIDELGVSNDTIVVFTSDNGAWPDAVEPFSVNENEFGDGGHNSHYHEGKGSTWEGGYRDPTIWRYPGVIPADTINYEITSHMDLFPTFLDFAGIPLPRDRIYDGKSLVTLLRGETTEGPHNEFYYWREKELYAVRIGAYKGHFVTRSGFGYERPVYFDPMVLFNIEVDPTEEYPLPLEEYSDIVELILQKAHDHVENMEFGPPQYDQGGTFLGQDWSVIPCCGQQDNPTWADDLREKYKEDPPEDWSLVVWEACLCPDQNENSINNTYSHPNFLSHYRYMGHPTYEIKDFMQEHDMYSLHNNNQ